MLWFNGRNLGRYWHEGPVQTVFIPAAWMKTGEDNELVVLELEMADPPEQIPTAPRQFWGRGQ
jgi:beta-galactosidase